MQIDAALISFAWGVVGECRTLQSRLAAAATGEAFVLQGGDCAEAFSQFSANRIRDSYRYGKVDKSVLKCMRCSRF